MQKNKSGLMLLLLLCTGYIFGQEQAFEPHRQITGYVSTQAEYISGLKIFERNYGVSIGEAGLLCTYQPLPHVVFKTTFVYRPGLSIDQMVNDVYSEWKPKDNFSIKAGRFLTPLSPLNLSQYGPMNVAASLPMLITHHNMYPMHVDGLSINGSSGDQVKFTYNVFAGGYFDAGYLAFDPIGYTGKEILYTEAREVDGSFDSDVKNTDMALFGALGGHVGVNVNDVFSLGLNSFFGGTDKYVNPFDSASVAEAEQTNVGNGTKHSFGLDFKLKLDWFQVSGEQWFGKLAAINEPSQDISGGFYQASGSFGGFTPYLQYERHLMYDLHYSRYVAGINYKPTFETTFKMEYCHSVFDGNDDLGKYSLDGVLATFIYSF